MKNILIWSIKAYKQVSPFIVTGSCRFYPTCSSYAIESIERFGVCRGVSMAFIRILKCHPFYNSQKVT